MKNGHGSKMVENRKKETSRWTRLEQHREKRAMHQMRSAETFLARIHGKNRKAKQSEMLEKSMDI
jgi:hypothetical protein